MCVMVCEVVHLASSMGLQRVPSVLARLSVRQGGHRSVQVEEIGAMLEEMKTDRLILVSCPLEETSLSLSLSLALSCVAARR